MTRIIPIFALLGLCLSLSAQTRYLDPVFNVGAPTTVAYGQNVDVFLQAVNVLEADVWQPEGDDADTTALRPVVAVFPTGNFLIQYLNQGPYGSRRDSAVVDIISRVVQRGYVGMSVEYRTGWLPTAQDQDIRTSSLLQAAYRGGQDAHALARYLRKTVVEDGNPLRIDTNRIVFMGLGTGGYVTMTHAFLDDVQEVLDDDRFYDVNDQPYVDERVNADPQGTQPAFFDPATQTSPSNIPVNAQYNSDVAMSINVGGALGDLDWMTGAENEPHVLGYHSPSDPFAPFSVGTVIVPTTGDIVISGVAGTEAIVEKANMLGLNDELAPANAVPLPAMFGALSTVVNATNAAYKPVDVDLSLLGQSAMVDLSHDNMFPLSVSDRRTPRGVVGSPFNWIDSSRVKLEVAGFNAALGQEIDADALVANEGLTNPNAYNAEGARRSIDTIMAHFYPRAWFGLSLDELPTSTNEIQAPETFGLQVFPNPAVEGVTIRAAAEFAIRDIKVYNFAGRVVREIRDINNISYRMERGDLPPGQYFLQMSFDEGSTVAKVLLH